MDFEIFLESFINPPTKASCESKTRDSLRKYFSLLIDMRNAIRKLKNDKRRKSRVELYISLAAEAILNIYIINFDYIYFSGDEEEGGVEGRKKKIEEKYKYDINTMFVCTSEYTREKKGDRYYTVKEELTSQILELEKNLDIIPLERRNHDFEKVWEAASAGDFELLKTKNTKGKADCIACFCDLKKGDWVIQCTQCEDGVLCQGCFVKWPDSCPGCRKGQFERKTPEELEKERENRKRLRSDPEHQEKLRKKREEKKKKQENKN